MEPMKGGSCPGCVCCQACGTKGFQKLVEVEDIGLVIYRYSDNQSKDNEDNTKEKDHSEDIFIVHNKNDIELKNDSMKKAIDKYAPSCPRCRKIVEHVNNLIDNIQGIDQNKIIGICDLCKMRDIALKKHCDCEKILKKFMSTKQDEKVKLTSQMKEWITKIQDKYSNITYDHDKQRIRLNIEKEQIHRVKDIRLPGIKEVKEHETGPRIEEFRFTDYPKQSFKETKVRKKARVHQGKVTYVSDDELPQYRRSQQYDHELERDDLRFNKSVPDWDSAETDFKGVKHIYDLKSEEHVQSKTKTEKSDTWQRTTLNKSSVDEIDLPKTRQYSEKTEDHAHEDYKYVDRDDHRGHLVQGSHMKEVSTKTKEGLDPKHRRIEHTRTLFTSDDDLKQMDKSKHYISTSQKKEGHHPKHSSVLPQIKESMSKEHVSSPIHHYHHQPTKYKIHHEDISQPEELLKYVKTLDTQRKDVSPASDKVRSLGGHEIEERHKEHDEKILRHKRKHTSDEHLPRTISTLPKHHLPSEVGFKYYFPKMKKKVEATLHISSTELVRETKEKILKKTLEEKEKKRQIDEKLQAEKARKLKEQEEKLLIKKQKEEEEEARKQKELEENLKLQKLKDDADEKQKQKKLKEQGDMTADKKSGKQKKGDDDDEKGMGKEKGDKQPKDKTMASGGADGTSSKGSKPTTDIVKGPLKTTTVTKEKTDTKEDDIAKSKVDKAKDDTTKTEDKKSKDQSDKTKDGVSTKDKQTLETVKDGKGKDETKDKQKDVKTKDDVGGKDKGKDDAAGKEKGKDDATGKEKAKDKTKDDVGGKDKPKDDAGKEKPKEDANAKDKGKEKGGKGDASALANDKLKQMLAQQAKIKEEQEKKARELAEKKAKEAAEAVQKEKDRLEKEKKPETEEEKARREKAQKEQIARNLDVKHIKVRNLSNDDNILNLIKVKQKAKCLSDLNVTNLEVAEHCNHRNRLNDNCVICKDSDLELDVESVVRRTNKKDVIGDIIIGNKIFKYKTPFKSKKEKDTELRPMLFKVASLGTVTTYEEPEPVVSKPPGKKDVKAASAKEDKQVSTKDAKSASAKDAKAASAKDAKSAQAKMAEPPELGKGVIKYSLSDRAYIEKGWTMLPTEKVVRKMNVYRMRPAHPEFDWFEHNKEKGIMKYDTGERLADFDDQGRGRWYYRNGGVALDYYDAEEINAQQRFVIYSSGLPDEGGHYCPVSVLASFDYLGNGVVFDNAGKIRLKYNQTEGVVLDRSLGPVSHWKWHTLNDPPVLQQVMIDTYLPHKDPGIANLGGPAEEKFNPDNEEMLAIEFDNFVKEKSKKLTQKFKPFQIRMKALKINDNFSLKVLDQATVYLIYRDGSTNLKLNLGMILNHQEIIDTDTAEVGEVSNSLERLPARTDSLAGLQQSVLHAQRLERIRTERERRLRRPEPSSSIDKLKMGISRPIRTPMIIPCTSCNAAAGSYMPYICRKPCGSNVYYNTGFI